MVSPLIKNMISTYLYHYKKEKLKNPMSANHGIALCASEILIILFMASNCFRFSTYSQHFFLLKWYHPRGGNRMSITASRISYSTEKQYIHNKCLWT